MTPLYFSRATLRRSPDIDALAKVLAPEDDGARRQTDHRLIWSLFAGDPDAKRDFLFRREDRGVPASRARFLILSQRPPNAGSALFEVETQDFAPALAEGDQLGFSLLANPAVTHWRDVRGKRIRARDDVVMHALSAIPQEERAARRSQIVSTAGRAWLAGQGAQAGFLLDDETLTIDGYDQFDIDRDKPRHRGKKDAISVSVLAFDGFLTLTDPNLFLAKLIQGFGRARAFGCGLMLIRRAR